MPIEVECPSCKHNFSRPEALSGNVEKCPKCSHAFRLSSAADGECEEIARRVLQREDVKIIAARPNTRQQGISVGVALIVTDKELILSSTREDKIHEFLSIRKVRVFCFNGFGTRAGSS